MFRNDPVTTVARGIALVISLIMVFYFATSDALRSDNPFLIPDAVIMVLLGVAALLPRPFAVPGLAFTFTWAAAVFTVAWFTYVVRGEIPVSHPLLIGSCLAMAILLLRGLARRAAAQA